MIWAGYSLATEAYDFWKHGVAKPAKVIALDHTNRTRGGTIYYYELEIDGETIVERFRVRLPVGKTVSVLTLPDKPNEVMPGSRESTWFDLYSYSIGGKFIGVLSLAMFGFMIIWGPKALVIFIGSTRKHVGKFRSSLSGTD